MGILIFPKHRINSKAFGGTAIKVVDSKDKY